MAAAYRTPEQSVAANARRINVDIHCSSQTADRVRESSVKPGLRARWRRICSGTGQ